MNNNNICELCTSCRACEMICPKNAINMKEDEEGFLIPNIDEKKCVNCNLCRKICPQNKNVKVENYLGRAYAAQILDRSILLESTSGGFFSALANEILNKNGIVFGANMDNELKVTHKSIDNFHDLKTLRGSKYVASDTLNTFREVKHFLDNDRYVLYSGCPCQVAGLKSFLNTKYEKLITVDVICHGTPSYKLFDTYRKGMEEKLGTSISDYKFRDKSKYGWGVYWSFLYNRGRKKKNGGLNDNPYVSAFINGIANKEACYKCKYVGFENRPGDITLGDFWGVDIVHPDMASNDGVSAVIINSLDAKEIVMKALKHCKYVITEKENISKYNPSLVESTNRPAIRDKIYDGINEKKPLDFIKTNLKLSYKDYLKTKVRLLFPYKIRVLIKRYKNKLFRI